MSTHLLADVAESAQQVWREAYAQFPEHVVPQSCAAPWFGDSAAYALSPLRVVTAGLNPSGIEFPAEAPRLRFPNAREGDPASLTVACDGYFRAAPYWQWFQAFEPALQGLGSSFRDGRSIALHTDLCSPVPTAPTWSELPTVVQWRLRSSGLPLWLTTLEALAPHVVLISTAIGPLRGLPFWEADRQRLVVELTKGKQPVRWSAQWVQIADRATLVIAARAAQKPLGYLKEDEKVEAGRAVLRLWEAGPW